MKERLVYVLLNINREHARLKIKMIPDIANVLEVRPEALNVPDIEPYVGIMQTLFTLEDLYGLNINSIDGEVCLTFDKSKCMTYVAMFEMFYAWQQVAEKLKNGEITKEEYDNWRYNYPKSQQKKS